MGDAFAEFAVHWLDGAYEHWLATLHMHVRNAHSISLRMDVAESAAMSWTEDVEWEEGEAPHLWEGSRQIVLGFVASANGLVQQMVELSNQESRSSISWTCWRWLR